MTYQSLEISKVNKIIYSLCCHMKTPTASLPSPTLPFPRYMRLSLSGIKEAAWLLSFLFNSYKKINSPFLRFKGNRNADLDKNISKLGLFEGHNLFLYYINIYENIIFIFLTWEYFYSVNICYMYIQTCRFKTSYPVIN